MTERIVRTETSETETTIEAPADAPAEEDELIEGAENPPADARDGDVSGGEG